MRDTFSASAQECLPAELAIGKRRAIKHFDSSYRIPSEVFARIVAGISVLAGRVDLGRVVIVDVRDAGIRQGIARVGFAQPQYTEASRILVLCYDLGAAADTLSGPQYNRRRDAAMIRAGLVAQRLMISAAQLGVDSCPMIGFDYQEVGRLLRKPGECLVLMIVALGRRREDPPPRPPRLDVKDIVTYNGLS